MPASSIGGKLLKGGSPGPYNPKNVAAVMRTRLAAAESKRKETATLLAVLDAEIAKLKTNITIAEKQNAALKK